MIYQIRWRSGGTMTGKIFWRSTDYHTVGTQVFRHHVSLMDITNTDSQVDAFIHQINHPVGQIQLNTHLRPGLQKRCGQWRDNASAKRSGRANAQRPRRSQPQALNRTFGYRHLLQHAAGFFKIDASGIGQALATRIALQQTRTELRFQMGDIFSHHYCRHLELRCRGGKASALYHGDKRLHAAQFIHIANLWLVII